MKKFSAITVIFSVLAIAIFGFLVMHPESVDGMARCIAQVVAGANCPAGNSFALSFFHIDAFKSLSLATFAQMLQVLALIAVASVFLLKVIARHSENKVSKYLLSAKEFWAAMCASPLALHQFIRHISFFTHSPCGA